MKAIGASGLVAATLPTTVGGRTLSVEKTEENTIEFEKLSEDAQKVILAAMEQGRYHSKGGPPAQLYEYYYIEYNEDVYYTNLTWGTIHKNSLNSTKVEDKAQVHMADLTDYEELSEDQKIAVGKAISDGQWVSSGRHPQGLFSEPLVVKKNNTIYRLRFGHADIWEFTIQPQLYQPESSKN